MLRPHNRMERDARPVADRRVKAIVRPFRFGIGASRVIGELDQLRELARRSEGSGFSTLTIGDHPSYDRAGPITSMLVAALATSTLRIGSYVLCNDYRHPALLARELATIDQASSGRVELGLGAGWLETDYQAAGLGYDPAKVRIARLTEALQIWSSFFANESVSFVGEHYQLDAFPGYLSAYQQPRPPLLVGGGGRSVLSAAARFADIVAVNDNLGAGSRFIERPTLESSTRTATQQKIDLIRDVAGSRFDQIELGVLVQKVIVTTDRSTAAQGIAATIHSTPEEVLDSPRYLIGDVREIADLIVQRRSQTGISYIVVVAQDAESFGPVVDILGGT